MAQLDLTVVGHPVPKGGLRAVAYRSGKVGLFYPPQVREWEALVREAARAAMEWNGLPVFGAKLNVSCRFHINETKSSGRCIGDLDKLVRGVFDAMTGPVYTDDDMIVGLLATKQPTRPGELERVEIAVSIADTSDHGYGKRKGKKS